MTAIQLWQSSVTQTCIKCGIAFAMPIEFDAKRREDRKTFYCPNGHPQAYCGETEAHRLAKQLEASQRRNVELEESRARARKETEAAMRQTAAQKANVTKLKKRAEAGVCAHCNRTFDNVARHMKTKHTHEAT